MTKFKVTLVSEDTDKLLVRKFYEKEINSDTFDKIYLLMIEDSL